MEEVYLVWEVYGRMGSLHTHKGGIRNFSMGELAIELG